MNYKRKHGWSFIRGRYYCKRQICLNQFKLLGSFIHSLTLPLIPSSLHKAFTRSFTHHSFTHSNLLLTHFSIAERDGERERERVGARAVWFTLSTLINHQLYHWHSYRVTSSFTHASTYTQSITQQQLTHSTTTKFAHCLRNSSANVSFVHIVTLSAVWKKNYSLINSFSHSVNTVIVHCYIHYYAPIHSVSLTYAYSYVYHSLINKTRAYICIYVYIKAR